MRLYVPLVKAGLAFREQGAAAGGQLFGTSYAEYEHKSFSHMEQLFGGAGFNSRRYVVALVLNRWGHPAVVLQAGLFFGSGGAPTPRGLSRQRFGRVAFAHSKLQGIQAWEFAVAEGRRAYEQAMTDL